MPTEYDYPGVYIEETQSNARPIAGVDTSTAAFAGWTAVGPVDRAELVLNWKDFESKFGGYDRRSLLGYAVSHFFENGGRKAYIVRVAAEPDRVLAPNEADFENALLPADSKGGLYLLDNIDLFNLLCVPGETNPATLLALQKFCRYRRAFLIADCPQESRFEDLIYGPGNIVGEDSSNCAFYFPWVLAPDALDGNAPREFPPCGFVAGIYARTDELIGAWKAPAGVQAKLFGSTGVAAEKKLTDNENGILNPKAINCIRTFTTYGTVVWGARTLHGSDQFQSEWKYVPVRRMSLFLEESISRGLQWVVFEPNGEPLWVQIRLNVENFLYGLFREGALQGRTPSEAYFVKCDRSTMTESDINNGIVNIVIGFAPLKPAEFVIIRLQQLAQSDDPDDSDDLAVEIRVKENVMAEFKVNRNRFDPYKNFKFRVKLDGTAVRVLGDIVESAKQGASKLDGVRTALFAGEKGSGKHVTAETIAEHLGVEVQRVDLSQVVSKYIGETEKNLRRVFEAAEKSGAILFFDEADALFGKRSEVRDAHDRYANTDVDHLLQQIESHNGLVILATNLKQNLDPAFIRRLRYVIEFPKPEEET